MLPARIIAPTRPFIYIGFGGPPLNFNDALRALVDAAPDEGTVIPVPAGWLRRLLDGDSEEGLAAAGREIVTAAGEPPTSEQLLTVEELAQRLSVTPDYVYRNASQWPFTRRLSPKMLRFSEAGLRRWLAIRR